MASVICKLRMACPVSGGCKHAGEHDDKALLRKACDLKGCEMCLPVVDKESVIERAVDRAESSRTAIIMGNFAGVESMRRTAVILLDQIISILKGTDKDGCLKSLEAEAGPGQSSPQS